MLQEMLDNSHLLLRRAAVACLRQLAQREAREVCEHAVNIDKKKHSKDKTSIIGKCTFDKKEETKAVETHQRQKFCTWDHDTIIYACFVWLN